eukprot:jgi/Bigna1/73872/fgenesh1_pg.26_\
MAQLPLPLMNHGGVRLWRVALAVATISMLLVLSHHTARQQPSLGGSPAAEESPTNFALGMRRPVLESRHNLAARTHRNLRQLIGGADAEAAGDADPMKPHLSVVICGHVDSGKSTTTGRLLFELGGIDEREIERLKTEAKALNKETFLFAFYMDRQKEERERGVTITCATKEFFTKNWHYTIIDAPGHRDFIKNMISGAAQADCAVLMLPADGNAWTAIQKGNHKVGEVQGQTRHHARLLNLLGVKQLICCLNKMDCDQAKYKEERYNEILKELKACLAKVGWKKDFLDKSVPFIPLSGWNGDNLLKKSENMEWWKGADLETVYGKKLHINTLLDCLNDMVQPPERKKDAPLRLPIAGVYRIKGVGDVLAGRVEQGVLKNEADVTFLPTHTPNNPCTGKVFSIEMHHKRVQEAQPGDNVGMNVKGIAFLDGNGVVMLGKVVKVSGKEYETSKKDKGGDKKDGGKGGKGDAKKDGKKTDKKKSSKKK